MGTEVEVTEADTGLPETTESALSLSKARLDAQAPKPATPKAPPVEPEQPAQAQAAAESEAEGTKPSGQSAPKKADFSFMADPVLRAAFEGVDLPTEAQARLKKWAGDYTQKSQKVSEYEPKAKAWEDLAKIPGAQKVLADLLATAAAPPEPEQEIDLTQASNEDILAFIRSEARKLAKEEAAALLRQEIVEPASSRNAILSAAKGMYGEWSERLDESAFKQAWNEAVSHYGEDSFTPANTERLFSPFLERAAVVKELTAFKGKATKDADVARRATSPTGSGSIGSNAAATKPTPKADGLAATARANTLREMAERYGWTERDLESAAKT